MDEDSGEVLDLWPKRRGPGYFVVILISVIVSALIFAAGHVALVRVPAVQRALGTPHGSDDRALAAVPTLTKIPIEAASQLAEARGLKLLSTGSAAHAEIPPGWVMEQSLVSGTKVRRGRTVRVKLSSGPPLVQVPPVVGTKLLEAQQLLLQAGLRVGSVESAALLRVTASRPAPGEQAATGAPVTLIVELAPPAETEQPPARSGR